jgi:signal transduction histidine kinase/CheY-like chemotaxis protein
VTSGIPPTSSDTYTGAGHPWATALLRKILDSFSAQPAEKLRRAQLTGILSHSSTASVISTLFALILAVYLVPVFGVAAYIWFGLKVAAALPRFLLGQAFRYGLWTPGIRGLGAFVLTSLAIDGAVWGLAGVWGASAHGETVALLVACLASVAMLATFALQVQLGAAVAYVFPMLVPVVAALAFRGDALGLFAAGGTVLVLIQTFVTSRASERRMTREFVAREELAEALDEVKRQSSVKTLFLGTMSHELRTPLHGILGLAELIEREATDPKTTHHLKLIRSSGSHLLELIGALLDVSRIDSGKLELHLAPIDLAAETANLAALYSARATTKGIGFEKTIELGDTCWVQGDGTRIRQILHNLFGNAIKFTRRGLVSMVARETGDGFVFEIADTGPGIESRDLPHIFDAFRQADDSATRPSEGAGLGLTIARELAQAMNGTLEVESTVGVGSRFTLTIRPRKLRPHEVPASARPPSEPQRLRSSFHVLLVEDNDVNALIAESHLGRLGVRITRVHDGRQAVQASFGASRPDLILMDCRMPVLDGVSAAREIRGIEKSTNASRVPIIALTAAPGEDDREECFEAGMDGFLTKPFTDVQLLKAIYAYLQDAKDERMREHPLYDFAVSLEDTDVGPIDDVPRTMH